MDYELQTYVLYSNSRYFEFVSVNCIQKLSNQFHSFTQVLPLFKPSILDKKKSLFSEVK